MKDKSVILIVDDQTQNIELLEAYLAPRDYEIVTAASGEEALRKLSDNQIDLILLDIIMPGMDGFEVTRRVRQDDMHRLLPIIMVTVLQEAEDRIKGIEAGCDDFISKPIDKTELLARVRSLLKVKAYNDLLSSYRNELESEVTRRTEQLKQALKNLQRDIIERKRVEEALRESEEKFRVLADSTPAAVMLYQDDRWIYANKAAEIICGYSEKELLSMNFWNIVHPDFKPLIQEHGRMRQQGNETTIRYEFKIITKDGTQKWVDLSGASTMLQGRPAGIITVLDVTDRKKAEETLKESENKYRLLADNVHDVIFVLDMNLNYTYVSPSTKFLRGYEPDEVMKQPPSKALTPSSWDLVKKTIADAVELGKTEHREINIFPPLELEMIRKDGTTIFTEVKASVIRDENRKPVGILGVTRDISERKRAEEALQDSEEQYRLVVENAKESIFIIQDIKIVFVNRAVIGMVGYSKETLTSKPFTDFIHPDDLNMVVDHHIRRIKGDEVPPVYSFRVIGQDGTVIWCELNAAVIQWKGKPATLAFLTNITERKRADEELQKTLERLKQAFGSTIQVMVSAVEMRDPYTAGHQLRVSNLACAIADEMGLPNDKIEGLRMAGFIHDIGKLSIPAETLSKPTKLTNIEFSLIKEHSLSGYEMLKNVESPWPLAQIVYQHHERMNGSGYPRNLKGDEILLEARIMAVADVVEAMASHRPYRPTLGIESALEEIEKNKGILYDEVVADACLRLFRKKGYKLIA
jgi:PAS domain S-box-containing protein/putative nucleotidyltransferase with HDIG domain